MIVQSTDFGWEIIHQQAHGLLAVQAALHWHPDKRPVRWIETLVALTEHDDGQEPWEGRNHLTEAGAPKHFQIQQYSVEQCRNMIAIALEKSRWNALMVSKHASYLYESKRGEDKELDEFLDQQKTNQRDWTRQLKSSVRDVQYAYDFLQWCDALSLILCMGRLPDDERKLEISPGPDRIPYFISQRSDQTLAVEPWPFDVEQFSIHVEVYAVRQLAFSDDHELYDALHKTELREREWTFRR